jgi:hypothetical protein
VVHITKAELLPFGSSAKVFYSHFVFRYPSHSMDYGLEPVIVKSFRYGGSAQLLTSFFTSTTIRTNSVHIFGTCLLHSASHQFFLFCCRVYQPATILNCSDCFHLSPVNQ